jgi:hypothetical protein
VRELPALAGDEVQREDLDCLFACGAWSQVCQGDRPTVWAEGEWKPDADPNAEGGGRIHCEPEGRIATGRAEPPQSTAVGADDEDALRLLGRHQLTAKPEVIRHLEHDVPAVRAHPDAMKRADDR